MVDAPDAWVLITGASSGFGEEFARQYAARGHPLVLVARRLERLETLAADLRRDHGVQVMVQQADLSDLAAVAALHARLAPQGVAVELLINNAGHGLQGGFLDAPLEEILALVQLDITSLTAMTRIFGADMCQRGHGKILLVASILAYYGAENMAVYGAAKAFVLRLGEALHQEFRPHGVTVTALCPGLSDTGFAQAAKMKLTPALKALTMQPGPVVRAGIRALDAGRMSAVTGFANQAAIAMVWATPRWLHQALFARVMKA